MNIMDSNSKIYPCNWQLVMIIPKEYIEQGIIYSIVDSSNEELKIYLGKDEPDKNRGYEVLFFKKRKEDHYFPSKEYDVSYYEETEDSLLLFFNDFNLAKKFVQDFIDDGLKSYNPPSNQKRKKKGKQ